MESKRKLLDLLDGGGELLLTEMKDDELLHPFCGQRAIYRI